jgi:hypothetical protein
MGKIEADKINGDLEINQVDGDLTQAERDVIGRDKIVNIHETHHHYDENKQTPAFISRLTPYLANRVDQELKLGQSLKRHNNLKQPFLCVIHGQDNDCSDIFVDRIIHCKYFKKIILKQSTQGIKRYQLSCDKFKNATELHQKMQTSLAQQILNDMFADAKQIADTLAAQNCPIILSVTLSSRDCLSNQGIKNIESFLDYWSNWLVSTQQQNLLLIFLCFEYKPIKQSLLARLLGKKTLNHQIKYYFSTLSFEKFNFNGVVLPELNKIEHHQVDDWARIHLSHIYEKLTPKIKTLFEQHKQAIAMQPLAIHLDKMLRETT